MNLEQFDQQLARAQKRLVRLQEQADLSPGAVPMQADDALGAALTELSNTLAELDAVGAELQQQNHTLAVAHQLLDAERQRYQGFFDFAPDAYVVTDDFGTIQDANRAAGVLLGVPPDHLAGKPLPVFVAPDARSAFRQQLDALRRQPPDTDQRHEWETCLQPRQGSSFPAELTVSSIYRNGHHLAGFRWLLRDITERKQAQRALEQSEARQRALVEAIPDGVVRLQRDGTLLDVKAPTNFAPIITQESIVGQTTHALLSPELARRIQECSTQVLETGTAQSFEYEIHVAGDIRTREARIMPSGEQEVVIFVRDVTERTRAARENAQLLQQLRASQAQLRFLNKRMADIQEGERKRIALELHDRVGQNLTVLNLNLNLIRTQIPPDVANAPKIYEWLSKAQALLEETTERVRDVIADLRPSVLDDYGLFAALEWYTERIAERTELRIALEGAACTPRCAPPVENALFHIVQEALTNILKHAQASQASVCLESDSHQIRLTISDNGSGMPPELQDDPSHRSGWGLLNIRERAAAIGGAARIESVGDQGTAVIVEVPR